MFKVTRWDGERISNVKRGLTEHQAYECLMLLRANELTGEIDYAIDDDDGERVRCRLYATTNHRSPFMLIIGERPARSAAMRSCLAGAILMTYPAFPEELEVLESSKRDPGFGFCNAAAVVRYFRELCPGAGFQEVKRRIRKRIKASHGEVFRVNAESVRRRKSLSVQTAKKKERAADV